MRTSVLATAFLLAFVWHGPALAQASIEERLQKMEQRLRYLEERVAAQDRTTEANLAAAREAWTAACVPYQQSEVYRFGNAIVDDWEGRVNAWPLDEGLIDDAAWSYGAESEENPGYRANVIANRSFSFSGKTIDAGKIDKGLLESLHELGGVEANVATGYHAVEFLLWGQDLNDTGSGAGNRPASDFDPANCSWGNCDRRAAYLKAAIDALTAQTRSDRAGRCLSRARKDRLRGVRQPRRSRGGLQVVGAGPGRWDQQSVPPPYRSGKRTAC